jgi:hypothetical protein
MCLEEVASGVGFVVDGRLTVPTHERAPDWYCDFEDVDKLTMKCRDFGAVK